MISNLQEFRRREFQRETDKPTADRARKVPYCRYKGITRDGIVYYDVRSASGHGSYVVKIKLEDFLEAMSEEDLTPQEVIRLAIDGDIKVHCSCPAYRYWGFEYINTQLDSNEGDPQERFPIIRNPHLTGILCKHIYKVLQTLPMNWNTIASDVANERYLEVR